ncbi:MAG: hypothetical protein AAGI23_07605 [Bacteroidota bacterium]
MNKQLESYPHLVRLAEEGYDFHLSDYISKGVDFFKQDIGGFVSYTLLFFLISMAAGFVPFGSVLVGPPLAMGWAIVCYHILKDKHTQFNEFFKGFDHFGQLILVTLIMGLLMMLVIIPAILIFGFSTGLFINGEPDLDGGNGVMLFVGILALLAPVIYMAIAWAWAPYFVVFHGMKFWDAMEASRKILSKNWWSFFGFYLIIGLITVSGFIALGVGALFTIPIAYCAQFAAFADVVQLERADASHASIEDHLVE